MSDTASPVAGAADDALPLHAQARRAEIRETLVLETDDGQTGGSLGDISGPVLWGPVSLTTPALHMRF